MLLLEFSNFERGREQPLLLCSIYRRFSLSQSVFLFVIDNLHMCSAFIESSGASQSWAKSVET
ncbi:hypothetical protein FRX31_027990 [Thalictrum thalictroides]|uniref:Uncharacterized protein n=1 Tax=Thalictrum thalictroides TaxID=46969 RepID=A0A7J6VC08_THATH|nr:hypothetical protein FRX31_027990 [Thalictrum thalictroides]